MPTLVVQQGHCHRRTGATGTPGEQAFAAAVAEACVRLLHGRGAWFVRPILADAPSQDYRGDAFVAIHCDGSTSPAARGASIGYRTPEGQHAGQAWKRAYAARGWPRFRPDNYTPALQGYYGTGIAVAVGNRRAWIVECGFLTNPEDRALLTAPGGADRVALAIGDALGIPHDTDTTQEDDMPTPAEVWQHPVAGKGVQAQDRLYGLDAIHLPDVRARLGRVEAKLDALAGTLSDDEATILAAIREQGQDEGLTPEQYAAGLAEHLDDAVLSALVQLLDQRRAAQP